MISFEFLLEALKPEKFRRGAAEDFSAVVSDSRSIIPGSLFVALRGPRFDGNAFAASALKAGAGAVLMDEEGYLTHPVQGPFVAVPDTLIALQNLSAAYRRRLKSVVLGVTGSNGKTSTKEMLAGIFAGQRSAYTRGNLNNHIGVPLTLLAIPEDCEIAIVEMGMNHAGEIASLSRLARPDHAIITSVGLAHSEFFDSVLDIARAKLEITDGMKPGGVLLYHADSPGLELAGDICHDRSLHLISFGLDTGDGLRALFRGADERGIRMEFEGRELKNSYYFSRAMACNLFGAGMLAVKSGCILPADLPLALEGARPQSAGRFSVFRKEGRLLVDDTYNANLSSFSAALEDLRRLLPAGKLAVLAGEMAELGHTAAEAHREVGRRAAELGYAFLGYCGSIHAPLYAGEFQRSGGEGVVMAAPDSEELARKVLPLLPEFDGILVKGSRSSRMEKVSQAIKDQGYV
ncbi:MAG: UDP-N-acetylmuramoyl-tripeptide--D-alanyl-D-alanine ligase [Spirochaetales bacterium]|nr:UDP-N-acetylmuramoyl-tripeptide--D-alanyl-D-alanine ligase [Spirochaetales bacterium]